MLRQSEGIVLKSYGFDEEIDYLASQIGEALSAIETRRQASLACSQHSVKELAFELVQTLVAINMASKTMELLIDKVKVLQYRSSKPSTPQAHVAVWSDVINYCQTQQPILAEAIAVLKRIAYSQRLDCLRAQCSRENKEELKIQEARWASLVIKAKQVGDIDYAIFADQAWSICAKASESK